MMPSVVLPMIASPEDRTIAARRTAASAATSARRLARCTASASTLSSAPIARNTVSATLSATPWIPNEPTGSSQSQLETPAASSVTVMPGPTPPDQPLGGRVRVVRVDRQRERRRPVRLFTVDPEVIGANVAPLGDPPARLRGSRVQDDERRRSRLSTLLDPPGGSGRVPRVADQPRAQRRREARPHDVEMGREVRRLALPHVGAWR